MAPSIATLARATRVGLDAARTSEIERRQRADHRAMAVAICALLGPTDDAVDVGAHEGDQMAQMARCAPQGRHLAVEPFPEYVETLRGLMPPSVIVEEYALGHSDVDDEIELCHAAGRASYGEIHPRDEDDGPHFDRVRVRSSSLDALVERHGLSPKVIRISVEGAETAVLEGARRTIERCQPVLMIEHGTAAVAYGDTSSLFYDTVRALGLRIYDFGGIGPFDRESFLRAVGPFGSSNFLLRP
ncbi:MAG: FkbM family methyltransferase [Solirubrobacteraceae bacterium]|nr:FkbM family methyltransferase [Solirubrobacteraceae bacterium]